LGATWKPCPPCGRSVPRQPPEFAHFINIPSVGLAFTGRFGIVADLGGGNISLYLGRGSSIAYRGRSLSTNSGGNSQAEARFSAIVLGKLQSLASDANIRDDTGAVENVTSNSGQLGTAGNDPWVDRCMVFVFQLPDFGPVDYPFTAADFSFNYHSKTNTPGRNDLYGLATRVSPNSTLATLASWR